MDRNQLATLRILPTFAFASDHSQPQPLTRSTAQAHRHVEMAPTEKQIKAALKEGGKKGQDLAGMNAMGGVKFFCIKVDSALGEHQLLEKIMEGMNKEVDPTADDRKGGAGDLGKTIVFADDKVLIMLSHVPDELKETLDINDWFGEICASVKATPEAADNGLMRATVKADADNEIFPLKLRDTAVNRSYEVLVKKGLVRPDSDDDDENYAENAGIEW